MNDLETYWNDKYPKQKIVYSGRSIPKLCPTCKNHTVVSGLNIDVRTMITADDVILKQIIENNKLKAENDDQTILRIQKWVVANIKYVGDNLNNGVVEYWQFPYETIALGIADCEDGGITIVSLALNAGIPSYKIRMVAGLVEAGANAETGGHGYCVYLRESDNQFVPIDWCYYQDSNLEVKDKLPIKQNQKYKDVWFSFNDKFAWGEHSLDIKGRLALSNNIMKY